MERRLGAFRALLLDPRPALPVPVLTDARLPQGRDAAAADGAAYDFRGCGAHSAFIAPVDTSERDESTELQLGGRPERWCYTLGGDRCEHGHKDASRGSVSGLATKTCGAGGYGCDARVSGPLTGTELSRRTLARSTMVVTGSGRSGVDGEYTQVATAQCSDKAVYQKGGSGGFVFFQPSDSESWMLGTAAALRLDQGGHASCAAVGWIKSKGMCSRWTGARWTGSSCTWMQIGDDGRWEDAPRLTVATGPPQPLDWSECCQLCAAEDGCAQWSFDMSGVCVSFSDVTAPAPRTRGTPSHFTGRPGRDDPPMACAKRTTNDNCALPVRILRDTFSISVSPT